MPDERAAMDQVGRYWDAVVRGHEANATGVGPEFAATIRRVHELGAIPPAGAQERVWQQILMDRSMTKAAEATSLPPGRDHAHPPGAADLALLRIDRWRDWVSRRAVTHLATAALVVLTLVGSLLFAARGRFDRQRPLPDIIPAVSDTAATPQEPEPAGFAEFLWQSRGGPQQSFNLPGHPAIDPAGNIWVPDSGHDRFQIFSPDGAFLESWGTAGTGDGQFAFENQLYPMAAMAFAPDGALYVVDSGNFRIQKFGPDRSFLLAWGSEGSGPGQFKVPDGIAIDREGRVYVTDDGRHDLQVFDDQGHFLRKIGEYGFGKGQFFFSTGSSVFIDAADRIWVSDGANHRLQTFSPDGTLLSILDKGPAQRQFGVPGQIAIDQAGRIFVTVPDQQQVQVYAPDGTYLAALGSPDAGAWGKIGLEPGKFLWADGLVLDGKGNIYIVDSEMERLQKFRLLPPFA